jgi:hypothetical protein
MIKEIMWPSQTKLNSWVCGCCVQPLPGYCRTVIRGIEQGPKVPVYMDKAFSSVKKTMGNQGKSVFFHENENLKKMEVSLKNHSDITSGTDLHRYLQCELSTIHYVNHS